MILIGNSNDDWSVIVSWRRSHNNKCIIISSDLQATLNLEGSTCDHLASIMTTNRGIAEFLRKTYLNGADWVSCGRIEQKIEVNCIIDIGKPLHVILLCKLDVSNWWNLVL